MTERSISNNKQICFSEKKKKLGDRCALSIAMNVVYNAIQVLNKFSFLLRVTCIVFACTTNNDIWHRTLTCPFSSTTWSSGKRFIVGESKTVKNIQLL